MLDCNYSVSIEFYISECEMERKLDKILTRRKTASLCPSFKIVFEWEDIILSHLNLSLKYDRKWHHIFFNRFEKNGLTGIFQSLVFPKSSLSLFFVMTAVPKGACLLNKNTIPVIIDFWLKEEDLTAFYDAYKHSPLVLLTNAEVYEFLKKNNCLLNIEHWPLSFPDQYKLDRTENYVKEYEFCIFGRPNPFFIRLLNEYCEKNPDFIYIMNNGDISHRMYITNKGVFVAEDTGRQSYLEMIRKTKITCYTTPGLDEAKVETSQFNQVTPRLFEMLCGGCHVIGHYPDSADTQYYQLKSIVPNVDNYEQFESTLNNMRKTPADISKIKDFMSKHYTSTRLLMLKSILRKYRILWN